MNSAARASLPWGLGPVPSGLRLDDSLRVHDANGHCLCALGLGVTLYIAQGDPAAVRQGMLRAFERYQRVVGNVFNWGADPDTGNPVSVHTTAVGQVHNWPPRVLQRFSFAMAFHGGRDLDDADPHMFVALSDDHENDELSYLSAVMPLSWAQTHSPDDFVDWTIELCEAMGPTHGYAGPFVVPHVMGYTDAAAQAVYAIGRRLTAVEIDFPAQHAAALAPRRHIKGVNWLTILCNEWASDLNHPEPLGRRLGSASLRTFSSTMTGVDGIVLRAGARPSLGDGASQPPAYRGVAALTAPLRTDNPAVIWPQGLPGFDFAESLDWMRRYD